MKANSRVGSAHPYPLGKTIAPYSSEIAEALPIFL
jgi:hypothetical protein